MASLTACARWEVGRMPDVEASVITRWQMHGNDGPVCEYFFGLGYGRECELDRKLCYCCGTGSEDCPLNEEDGIDA